eukprot:COSAG06_NODE_62518_length_265_cov_0.108434_1_plen_58_part_10
MLVSLFPLEWGGRPAGKKQQPHHPTHLPAPHHPCSFFKQKTAYEMESRDWSSDVCSSD